MLIVVFGDILRSLSPGNDPCYGDIVCLSLLPGAVLISLNRFWASFCVRWFDSATHSTCLACVAPCSRILYCASSSASIAFWITLPFLGKKCKCSSANFLASVSVAAQLSQLLRWHPICWLWHGLSPGLIAWSVVLGGVLLLACLSASVFGSASFQAFFGEVLWFAAVIACSQSILAGGSFCALS